MTSKTEGCCRTGTMKIHIAHSPDSDDAFMFYGLATGKVRSNGFELEHVLSDIETLNRAAFEGRYEITAVSFHAYAHLTDRRPVDSRRQGDVRGGGAAEDRRSRRVVGRSPARVDA